MATALKLPDAPAFVVDNPARLGSFVRAYTERASRIYADTETTGFNPRTNKLVAIQMFQDGAKMPVIIDCRTIGLSFLNHFLNQLSGLTWVFHNAKFDLQFLMTAGIRLPKVYDTYVAEQVIHGVGTDGHEHGLSLKDVVLTYAGVDISKDAREWFIDLDTRVDMVTGGPPDYLEEECRLWHESFPPEQIEYMARDVLYLPDVMRGQVSELTKRGLAKTFQLEMRTLPAIAQMEMNGIRVDAEAWRAVIADKEAEAKELESGLYESELAQAILRARKKRFDEAQARLEEWKLEQETMLQVFRSEWEGKEEGVEPSGLKWGEYKKERLAEWKERHPRPPTPDKKLRDVNFSSSSQLLEGLSELGIQLPNTEAETLERAAEREPVLTPLVAFRKAQKFSSTYGESLLERIEEDGRIHPQFHQIGAETGRMSSSKPNFQNIPARTKDGARLRKCVVAGEGSVLLVTDFPNIELRILAELSGDEGMLEMFASGVDMHSFTARRMFGLSEDVDPKTYVLPKFNGLKARDVAKTINFGVVYGQSAAGFARKFKVDSTTAAQFIEMYFRLYPKVREYLDDVADEALAYGYSTTILGRKRYYDVPTAPNGRDWEAKKNYEKRVAGIRRQARNHPIQGTSADMTKLALAKFHESTDVRLARVVAVVHDEVVVEVPDHLAGVIALHLAAYMREAARYFLKRVVVPEIEVHVGKEWSK